MAICCITVTIPGKDTADGFSRDFRAYLHNEAELARFRGFAREQGLRVNGFASPVRPMSAEEAMDAVYAFAKTPVRV